ncbi:MAG: isopenicillin N synthase family dioxygenase [Oligoflexales bacterium]
MHNTIPIVDLNDYRKGSSAQKSQFVKDVGTSLAEIGFFAVINHGIDKPVIDKAYSICADFFRLNESTKRKYWNAEIKGQRGYTGFGTEHAKDHAAPDLKEFWHVGRELSADHRLNKVYPKNVWPTEKPEFRTFMLDLYKRLEVCALDLLEACTEYAGVKDHLFRDIAVDGNTILRLIHYPPIPETAHPESVRAAPHEDINLITLLIEGTTSGLELKLRDGTWMPVVTPPNSIIVDSGDMLQNISNGFFKSTTHRVVNPEKKSQERYSMPFFVHARGEVRLDPLTELVAKTGGKQVFPNITADEYLHKRLKEIGLA